jgi:uncharacterized protein (DUF433 family)
MRVLKLATILHIDEIVTDPHIRGGKPIIAGTTIRVSDIATWHVYAGQTPEELAVGFNLDMAKVYAALSYYFAHKDEIDNEMRLNAKEGEGHIRLLTQQGKVISLD